MRTCVPRSSAASSSRKNVTVLSLSKGGSMNEKVSVLVSGMVLPQGPVSTVRIAGGVVAVCRGRRCRRLHPDDFFALQQGVYDNRYLVDADVLSDLASQYFSLLQRETIGGDRHAAIEQPLQAVNRRAKTHHHYPVLHEQQAHAVPAQCQLLDQGDHAGQAGLRQYFVAVDEQIARHGGLPLGWD